MYILLCFLSLISAALHSNIQNFDTKNKHRYQCLQSFLEQYQRPFTMLEIGAKADSCSFKVAHNYQNSVCVITQNDQGLLDAFVSQNRFNNIILLNMLFSPDQLQHLADCEHFDLITAFDIADQFKINWQEAIDAMLNLGDHLVIDVPSSRTDINDYILLKGGVAFGEVLLEQDSNISILYMIKSQKNYLQRKTWLRLAMKNSPYYIQSDFKQKSLCKPNNWPKGSKKISTWLPGINLVTFKMCHGVYPTKEMLQESLLQIKDDFHSDWIINNMVLQGHALVTIDGDDDSCRLFFSQERLSDHQQILNLDDPKKVEHYFWNDLIKKNLSRRQIIKFFVQIFPATALIFNIGSSDELLIDRYLSYGAKVIYANKDVSKIEELHKKFRQEDFVVDHKIFSVPNSLLEAMILQHGIPKFCSIDMPAGTVFEVIKTLLQPVPCIAFAFDIRFQSDYIACLKHLALLGYKKFNFSVRDILGFALEPNKYIGTHKNWVHSTQELLAEINEYVQLDYDGQKLYGYIYAKD